MHVLDAAALADFTVAHGTGGVAISCGAYALCGRASRTDGSPAGFAVPYLRSFIGEAERVVAVMPAQMGVVSSGRPYGSWQTLVDEDALPFPDALFDCLLVVASKEPTRHCKANCGGCLHRKGNSCWSHRTAQVFGRRSSARHSRMAVPIAARNWTACCATRCSEPEWDISLLSHPQSLIGLIRTGTGWDRMGRAMWSALAGVHIVEAQKTVFGAVPIGRVRDRETTYAPA